MATYTLIQEVTIGSGGAANIEFTSIPATYTDLVILISCRGSGSGVVVDSKIQFNNSTSNYAGRNIEGNGTTIYSQTHGSTGIKLIDAGSGATSNIFTSAEVYIPNYRGNQFKSISMANVTENFGSSSWAQYLAGSWSDTSAITSIKLTPDAGTYLQHSSAYLYGISNT
jgi:hypothetical protein